jgi:hypothetical protein
MGCLYFLPPAPTPPSCWLFRFPSIDFRPHAAQHFYPEKVKTWTIPVWCARFKPAPHAAAHSRNSEGDTHEDHQPNPDHQFSPLGVHRSGVPGSCNACMGSGQRRAPASPGQAPPPSPPTLQTLPLLTPPLQRPSNPRPRSLRLRPPPTAPTFPIAPPMRPSRTRPLPRRSHTTPTLISSPRPAQASPIAASSPEPQTPTAK